MSFDKIIWALSVKIKPIPSRVLIQLCSHYNEKTGICCPSITSLQDSCQLSRQGVINSLRHLEDQKLIIKTVGYRGSNQYKLNTDWSSKLTSQESRLVKKVDHTSQESRPVLVKKVDPKQEVKHLTKQERVKTNSKRFKPPTSKEVRDYCKESGYTVDPDRFVDYNESKGWVVGKSPMKDWKAAVRTWQRNEKKQDTTTRRSRRPMNTNH